MPSSTEKTSGSKWTRAAATALGHRASDKGVNHAEHANQPVLASRLGGLFLAALAGSTGCQSLIGGQVLPSPWYQTDDVQYFAPGPEFKLSREAAAQKAFKEEKVPDG